ncbi:lysophospholipase L1-like esterase [Burkholderiales bacterium JOSHI_001]|nr:lysophospholipase L1-like esterase [Burkholderiales bacterium JOSHI_001]
MRRTLNLRRRAWLLAGAVAALLAACSKAPALAELVPAGASVLALGDSLTFGTGAPPEAAYPAVLAGLTGWAVHNAGVPGDTSAQALARLPELLAAQAPRLVLLCVGGNDLLRRLPEAELRDNIRRSVQLARAAGAQVLLIAVPQPSLGAAALGSLTDHRLYGELAQELNLPLQRQGWAEVLADDRLRSDAIHANAEGYRRFAQALRATALAVGLLQRTR